ncbi:MAG: HAD family phosphatase [Candidatus Eisenbacteria bacterium]
MIDGLDEALKEKARRVRLIAFDVDGTLVEHPERLVIWQLLNRRFRGHLEVSDQRYADFMAGKFDYETWVRLDVTEWIDAGATREDLLEEVRNLNPIAGARATVDELKARGYHLAVISGTLDIVIDEFFPEHPFDAVFTNHVHFDERGRLDSWTATRYDMEGKAHALAELARGVGVTLEECAFIGDHANDVEAAREAGFSIAFNPKSPALIEVADTVLRASSLVPILELFPGRRP